MTMFVFEKSFVCSVRDGLRGHWKASSTKGPWGGSRTTWFPLKPPQDLDHAGVYPLSMI